MRLPPRGVPIEDLRCKKCGKTMKECPPEKCTDLDCPQKPKAQEEK